MGMQKKSGNKGSSELPEIELGGLFSGLGEAVNLLGKLIEKGGESNRSGEFRVKGLGDKAKGVYGFSIRTLGEAGAKVERFGNVRSSSDGFVVDEIREPLVDVFDEDDQMTVTAELPGAKEDEISIELHGDILGIEAKGERNYAKEIILPHLSDGLTKKYNNGVLTITLSKIKQSNV
jgi:HSP20 family protein